MPLGRRLCSTDKLARTNTYVFGHKRAETRNSKSRLSKGTVQSQVLEAPKAAACLVTGAYVQQLCTACSGAGPWVSVCGFCRLSPPPWQRAASAALLRLCITNNSGANNLKKPTEMKQNTLAPVTHLTDSFHSFCQLKATSELKRFPFLSVLSFLASSADFFPVYLISN